MTTSGLNTSKAIDAPLVVAYGMGVDSTAALVRMADEGIRPDLILFADVGDEKRETYAYQPIIDHWLRSVDFPAVTTVTYQVQNFKNWPPYHTLGQNCLTNGTLPSLAFGFKSCSMKWKIQPQDKYVKTWQPAVTAWAAGQKVRKIIGYDASPKDHKRFAHSVGVQDPKYDYQYPLIDWGMDRAACKQVIQDAGLLVPPKSACIFCPSTKPAELHEFQKGYLRYIVMIEARAAPRLRKIQGLWRNGVKGTRGGEKKPGRMTDYIRENGLLSASEIDRIENEIPKDIILNQERHADGIEIPNWHDFLQVVTEEDAIDEGLACQGCSAVAV